MNRSRMSQWALVRLHVLVGRLASGWHPLRWRPVRRLVMAIVSRQRPEVMSVRHGFELWIPREDRSPFVLSLFMDGEYEPQETLAIGDTLRPGDLAFDVGANVGYMTCLMALAAAGEGGEVHAFEPEPRNFEILMENVRRNALKGVVMQQMALSSQRGLARLYAASENRGDHTLVEVKGRCTTVVPSTTFDDYSADRCGGRRVRLVKIDVQGFELEVVRGMRRSLVEERIDAVLLELWPWRVRRTGRSCAELPALLGDLPYDVTVLSETSGGRYRRLDEIVAACPALEDQPDIFFNLLIKRRDAHPR